MEYSLVQTRMAAALRSELVLAFVRVVLSFLTLLTGFGNLFGLGALLCKNTVRILSKILFISSSFY